MISALRFRLSSQIQRHIRTDMISTSEIMLENITIFCFLLNFMIVYPELLFCRLDKQNNSCGLSAANTG
jgi:hypothetical protein